MQPQWRKPELDEGKKADIGRNSGDRDEMKREIAVVGCACACGQSKGKLVVIHRQMTGL